MPHFDMYALEKYRGIRTRHTCPYCGRNRCFSYYVNDAGEALHPSVGRCDHESTCGYHYKPREFFADNHIDAPEEWKAEMPRKYEPKPLCTIPKDAVAESLQHRSTLEMFLKETFGEVSFVASQRYFLGAVADETIFWQIDNEGRVRGGKCIPYGQDGHRIKNGRECGWIHSRMKRDGLLSDSWELTQCFFGEHLLKHNKNAQVAIVESEKTAVICSIVYPEKIWLATGGKMGLNADKMGALTGREIIVFPDADAVDYWTDIVNRFKSQYNIAIAPIPYTEEQIATKQDIADIICQALKNVPRPTSGQQ